MRLRLHKTTLTTILSLGVLALTAAACAAPDKDTAPSTGNKGGAVATVGKDDAAVAKLPAAVKTSGVVRVASGVSFPPMEFFAADNKTVQGFDADLGKALGEALGVKFEFSNVNFDGIIGGLEADRYDVGITSMLDKKVRQEKVDFVDYLKSGVAIMAPKGNPNKLNGPDSLCGRKVAVEKGSTGDLTADDVSTKCTGAGKPALDKQPFPDQASAVQALQSSRADAVVALDLTLAYTVKQSSGAFEVVGEPFDTLPIGIAVPKKSTDLRDAVQLALKKVIASGVYDQLLTKWGLEKQALKDAPINAGTA
jgi:polar amino acid transport system substrate-binding protein